MRPPMPQIQTHPKGLADTCHGCAGVREFGYHVRESKIVKKANLSKVNSKSFESFEVRAQKALHFVEDLGSAGQLLLSAVRDCS